MKWCPAPFTLAARHTVGVNFSRQTWHLQKSCGYAYNAAASSDSRRPSHPRQKHLRPAPVGPPSDIGIDPDTAFQTAIMNLKITRPQDAPLPDRYDESSMPANVASVCKSLGLSFPQVRGAYNDRSIALNFSLSKKHCIHDYHMRDILDPLSPFQDWALDMQITRHEKESLWINVLPQHLKHISAVVQTRGAKRAKHAFAEALRRKGYDRRGTPLSEQEAEKAGIAPASTALYGTVRVRIFDLKQFCAVPFDKVVQGLERQIEQKLRIELGSGSLPRSHDGSVVRRLAGGGEERGSPQFKGQHHYGLAQGGSNDKRKEGSGTRPKMPRRDHQNGPSGNVRRSFI